MDLVILEVMDFIHHLLQALRGAEAEELVVQEATLALTIQVPAAQEEIIQFQVLQFIMQVEEQEVLIKMLGQDQVE
jgi:hypothetical protein